VESAAKIRALNTDNAEVTPKRRSNMPETLLSQRHRMITLDDEVYTDHFAEDVKQGLLAKPKKIPPKYFYDDRGSYLFEQICELPEYYLTRAEREILEMYSPEIMDHLEPEKP
jgi:uncharacterized SAM-dependent methyltransferase